jgi:patatin-like phospholipase/acyl hydrolase
LFKILALDGGGLRSVFQARLIDRIEKMLNKELKPDFYTGTSGGSIVACGLQKMGPADIVRFFQERGAAIFQHEGFLQEVDDLWNLQGAKYHTKNLQEALRGVFAQETLKDLANLTLITSFAVKHPDGYWQPVVFHNFPSAKNSAQLPIVDAILRSSAAPTYFPVYQDHCDGGVWGNNPSMAAVAAAVDPFVGRKPLQDLVVLSIGTGRRPMQLTRSKRDLGSMDWLRTGIVDVLLDANVDASHYYTRSLLGARYHRVQIDLKEDISLDESTHIPKMIELADAVDLRDIMAWMQGFWI